MELDRDAGIHEQKALFTRLHERSESKSDCRMVRPTSSFSERLGREWLNAIRYEFTDQGEALSVSRKHPEVCLFHSPLLSFLGFRVISHHTFSAYNNS